ncbi:MAG: DUF4352 domain-containing protein [Candidatus Pacebacteria bacterium]|nr:DUF4352 domain-containing protein [Candidatus Paceibacterota bacterium]
MDSQTPKKKSIFKRWWFWVIVVIVLFIIIAASGNSTPQKVGDTSSSTPATSSSQPQAFNVGDQVKIGDSILTVNKVSVTQGGEFLKPDAGDEFVNLNITIQNTSNTSQYVTTLGQMFIKDSGGNSYQVTTTDVTEQNISNDLDGQVIADSKRTGWVGFEVPAEDKGLQFQYQASEFGGNTVTVDLNQ